MLGERVALQEFHGEDAGLIHLAHPAFTDLSGDLVDAEPGAGIQGHGAVLILPLGGRGCNAALRLTRVRGVDES